MKEPRRGSTVEMVDRIRAEQGICEHGVMLSHYCRGCLPPPEETTHGR